MKQVITYRTPLSSTLIIIIAFLMMTIPALAQKPAIKSVDKKIAGTSEIVTITGENFDANPAKLKVTFGAAKATIVSSTNQVIEVQVPSGATFDEISVTHLTSGLIGYHRDNFLLKYGGESPFNIAKLNGQFDFQSGSGLYDICLCDFDGDNKVDVATANDNTTSINVFPNTSSGTGNINFNIASPTIPLAAKTLHIKCGDLNGDGKADIVLTEAGDGDRVFILKNNSSGTGNFSFSTQFIQIPGNKTKRVEIRDLDLDGKPELIVTDQSKNSVSVLVNNSTLSSISFLDNILNITIPGAVTTDGLDVGDINGDQLPEIVVAQFQVPTSNIFIIENKSTPGTVNLGPVTTIPFAATPAAIHLADFDGDGKKDILATQLSPSIISILLNQSTANSFTFATPKSEATFERNFGAGLGDLDGDGKTDIVVASLTQTELFILNNTSSPGSLSFAKSSIPTTYINRQVNIGDVDGNGIPDIVFTSIDKNSAPVTPASKVSVFENASCLVPTISPAGPLTVCAGNPARLSVTYSRGTTYAWKEIGSNTTVTNTNPYFDVTTGGEYMVTATATGCSKASTNTVTVTVGAGGGLASATASSNGPICVGSTLQLSVTDVGADNYKWTGPNGFTATGRTPTLTNFQEANVGRYYVDLIKGGCSAQQQSTLVEVIDIGSFVVTYPGSNVICAGNTKTLTISPILPGITYKWFNANGVLPGETNTTLTVNTTGTYLVKPEYPGCIINPTAPANIVVASLPTAAFSPAVTEACSGQLIQFNNQSTVDPNATVEYLWTFGDGQTSNKENPTHSYSTDGGFNAKLKVSYTGGACPNESSTQAINIIPAPVPTIINPDSDYDLCNGENLTLEVIGGTYNSYLWSTGETSPSIEATEAGTYTVEVKTNTCTLNAEREIMPLASPIVSIFADRNQINEGETVQLNAEGLNSYSWTPENSLSNPNIPNPVASPTTTVTYTVTGPGNNGCIGSGTFVLDVKGDIIVSKLFPKNFFSPNDDASNQLWIIENILDYPQCNVAIYDDKGIKVYESKPYANDWDGTFNGKKLPKGVYFYIIKCDGEENKPKAGSITLLK